MQRLIRSLPAGLCLLVAWSAAAFAQPGGGAGVDLGRWTHQPADHKAATVAGGEAVLKSEPWAFLVSPEQHEHAAVSAELTILEPATRFDFFGESWSAWPPRDFGGDRGYEAALLLRAAGAETPGGDDRSGYRAQLSHKYQDVALVKYPDGGYLRVAPCEVKLNHPHTLAVTVQGDRIVVSVDGKERIRCRDSFLPLAKGKVGVGASSNAKVRFGSVTLTPLPPAPHAKPEPHEPKFSTRQWLGGRTWVFDGDEPVVELHSEQDPSCFAKLRPGYKPQLTFDTHWGIENQGAFKEGASKWTAPVVEGGGGQTVSASWSARNVNDRFATRSRMTVGYDPRRGAYTYDIESELEVLGGEPFHFRYGYDFEHHTPLDPFRWQYFVVKGDDGTLYHRPVTPVDPGPQEDLYGRGLRMWYGRHLEPVHVVPAVEYDIADTGGRTLNTAVCAAFYDTGISFAPETAKPGTKVRVKYRYTGYSADEAEAIYKKSVIYPSNRLDPAHYYLFADEWPKLTFSQFEPMSKTWIYGRRPFMTAHNARPTYELATNTGVGSGFAMKLGPDSYGKADLAVPQPLPKGRYVVTALVKSDNATGPGGRIELAATQAKTNKVLFEATHYLGNGSFGWKRVGFALDLPEEAAGLSLGLGNAGTGDAYVTEVEFAPLAADAQLAEGVLPQPNRTPPAADPAPAGALADYRMLEQKGMHVLDHARGPFGLLELANVNWVVDQGRPALRFAENTGGRRDYPRGRGLDIHYMGYKSYDGRQTVPVAVAGSHGGDFGELQSFTIASWIKPAAEMGKGEPGAKGDIVGLGARRFVLRLTGQKAPYRLAAALNVNDVFESTAELRADRWYHVAMTGETTPEKKWRVRLYVDGKPVHEGVTEKFDAPATAPPSIILGAELFYFHDAYYRGLIGRTTVFGRALAADDLARLAAEPGGR